jgi:hypothetical protein
MINWISRMTTSENLSEEKKSKWIVRQVAVFLILLWGAVIAFTTLILPILFLLLSRRRCILVSNSSE